MASTRKLCKQQVRHGAEVRTWATNTGKTLTVTLCQDTDPVVAPYDVCVVFDSGEKPWGQVPAQLTHPRLMADPDSPVNSARPPFMIDVEFDRRHRTSSWTPGVHSHRAVDPLTSAHALTDGQR